MHARLPNNNLLVLMGDVTGHGVGAAMVTAIVASGFRMASLAGSTDDVPNLLASLNSCVSGICRGEYLMSICAIEFDARAGVAHYYTAGAPPIFKLKPDGTVQTFSGIGAPLGSDSFSHDHKEIPLGSGERLFLFTDCAYEMKVKGNDSPLGLRGLLKLLQRAQAKAGPDAPLERLRDQLVQEFDETLGGFPQEDDLTFVLAERRSSAP